MLEDYVTVNTTEFSYLPWAERIAHLKERHGFRTLEVGVGRTKNGDELERVAELLHTQEIGVAAAHDWYPFFAPNDAEGIAEMERRFVRNIERAARLGADRLIWYTGENERYAGDEAVEALGNRLQNVLKEAERHGVDLLLETEFSPHGTDPGARVALLKKLMTDFAHPRLGINFDAANVYVADEEPFPYAYDELKPWIRHVHLKDVFLRHPDNPERNERGHPQKGHSRTCICCPVGEGAVNYTGLLNALQADGYAGYLCLETHVPRPFNDRTVERGLAFIRKHYQRGESS